MGQPNYSEHLKQRLKYLCEAFAVVDGSGSPAMLYISAWHEDDKQIWYEFAGSTFCQMLDGSLAELPTLFRDSVMERRVYRYRDEDLAVDQEKLPRQKLQRSWDRLRDEGTQSGFVEAVYKIRDSKGTVRWLKDQASVEHHAEDGITLSLGCLTDVTKEMEAEAQLKRAEVALQNANHKLDRLANLDGLTQIANRRFFDVALDREWKRLQREKGELALILGDVDFFKAYNDNYGHQAGDECLRRLAKVLENSIERPADIAARYGGEEFVLILPNTSIAGAAYLAESIRRSVVDLNIPHAFSSVADVITLSLGVATLVPQRSVTSAMLIALADAALYAAKNQGRNRVVRGSDLPS